MATATKTSKPAKPPAKTAVKTAPRSTGKTSEKAAAAPAKSKQMQSSAKKTGAVKASTAKPAAPAARAAAKAAPVSVKPRVSAEQRRHYIEVAAYFIAERRGFPATSALENWTQAEAEIDRLLSEGKLNP